MSDVKPTHQNIYRNVVTGATPNPVMQNPDAIDEEIINDVNRILSNAVELIRVLIGAHQSVIAIVVQEDWSSIRKFFSLSEKYAAWADYKTPATGYGTHGWLLRHNKPVRMTQAELEGDFTEEDEKHFIMFAELVSETLEALWDVRNLRKSQA